MRSARTANSRQKYRGILDEINTAGVFLRGLTGERRREGCGRARYVVFPKPHPLEKVAVASVKHCSILAFVVLCLPLTPASFWPTQSARRGAEERDVCHG